MTQPARIFRLCFSLLLLELLRPLGGAAAHTPAQAQPDDPAPQAEIRLGLWDLVTALAWSPDGETLAAGAGEWVRLYGAEDQQELAAFHADALTHSLAFSPDGRRLAAGSRDGRVRVWDLSARPQTGQEPFFDLEAHKKGVNVVLFSPDGRRLVSGGNDAVARLWDLETGEQAGEMIGGTFAVPAVAFTADGLTLAVVNGDVVRLREVDGGRIAGTLRAEAPLFTAAYSPDGRILAAGDSDNKLHLWDPALAFRTGLETYPEGLILTGHEGIPGGVSALIWRVAFNPDGSRLASAGGDGTARLWAPENGAALAVLHGHTAAVTSLAFSPDGRRLATGSLDATIKIWGMDP